MRVTVVDEQRLVDCLRESLHAQGLPADAARGVEGRQAVTDLLARDESIDLVITGGSAEAAAIDALRRLLLPEATVVTPNLHEAALLTGEDVSDEAGMRKAAEAMVEAGCRAVLVKGGHLRTGDVVDLLYDGRAWHEWRAERLPAGNAHGTGCTLSAGIAAAAVWGHFGVQAGALAPPRSTLDRKSVV